MAKVTLPMNVGLERGVSLSESLATTYDCTPISNFSLLVSHRTQNADKTLPVELGSLICIEKDIFAAPPSLVVSVGLAELIPHKFEFPLLRRLSGDCV